MLITVYFVLTLIFLPVMVLYNVYGNDDMSNYSNYMRIAFQLGNLGQAESKCTHHHIGIESERYYKCSQGKLSNITHAGIIPS